MLGKLGALGAVSIAGVVGVGIYYYSQSEVSEKSLFTPEQLAEYRKRHLEKFPGTNLIAYEDNEAWKAAASRLLSEYSIVQKPKVIRHYCYSVADKDYLGGYKEASEEVKDIATKDLVYKICQVPSTSESKA